MRHMPHESPEAEFPGAQAATSSWRAGISRARALQVCLGLLAFILSIIFGYLGDQPAFYLRREDRWLLLAGALVLVVATTRRNERDFPLTVNTWLALFLAALLVPICLAGHRWVLAGYDLSRDEQMATFDAAVFASGHLVQKIPALWRDHADVLNTMYMYPSEHRGAWISSYLPINAALRALLGIIASPAITNPLLTAIGAVALWGCVRRIWPQDREAPVVASLLYVGSGQVLAAGMTAFAMPGHLAFNLVWLWLFLRRSWWADIAALIVGFGTVGLHQPLFHVMFAGPVLFLLLLERQWQRAALYAAGYMAIAAFWLWWPVWTWGLVQAWPGMPQPAGVDYFTRLKMAVFGGSLPTFPYMTANLLRFAAWQHLLLLPMMLSGWKVVRHDRLAGALAFGLLVTIFVMAVILPDQGHGFGYRYLHGLIGNCILLAIYGWKSLGAHQSEWRGLLVRASIAGGIVLLPLQLWMAHALYAPSAAANARIGSMDADYVVIGAYSAPFSTDLVHNPPALDGRPIGLIAEFLNTNSIAVLCRDRPRIALAGNHLFDRMNAYYGFAPGDAAVHQNILLKSRLEAAGCRVNIAD